MFNGSEGGLAAAQETAGQECTSHARFINEQHNSEGQDTVYWSWGVEGWTHGARFSGGVSGEDAEAKCVKLEAKKR